jgi:hypothetical protein
MLLSAIAIPPQFFTNVGLWGSADRAARIAVTATVGVIFTRLGDAILAVAILAENADADLRHSAEGTQDAHW